MKYQMELREMSHKIEFAEEEKGRALREKELLETEAQADEIVRAIF